MKILLTGASGFVAKRWLEVCGSKHEIYSLGRSKDRPSNCKEQISIDLSEPGALSKAIENSELPEKIDAIVHLAVSRLHRTFPHTANDMFEVNVAATAKLLDYAWRSGAKQFILGSSGSVYDGCQAGQLAESRALAPYRYFPASKLAGELLANQYRQHFNIATIRFFTPYGPNQTDRLIPDIIDRVKNNKPVTLPIEGDGISLCALYIDDCVKILENALENSWNTTVNAANPEVLSIAQIARIAGERFGKDPIFERKENIPSYILLPELDVLNSLIDVSKLLNFDSGLDNILDSKA